MKDHLKEKLSTSRTNKTLIWQTMILTIGGVLGLFLKAVNSRTNLVEISLMALGLITVVFLAYIIGGISNEMDKLHKQLKQEESKNE